MDKATIEAMVRQVVLRTLGTADSLPPSSAKRPLLDSDTVQTMPAGSTQQILAGTIITPLARQAALERHIRLESVSSEQYSVNSNQLPNYPITNSKTIAIGADHGGYELKELLKKMLTADYQVIDCGTHSQESVDYPDFAYAVARLVADGRATWGIIIDGAGIGSCMAANKVPGVRAAMCYDQATAVNSREHNNANVLTLGAGLIGPNLAQQIVSTWLATDFGGGRHARRVNKIDEIGRRFAKQ
jgi:ribose 5-phosphate isomerase B